MRGLLFFLLLWTSVGTLHAKPGSKKVRPVKTAPPALYVKRSTEPIIVVWPPEGLELAGAENEFILGSVSDPKAPFKINDQTVPVHRNGAFLAWLPVRSGTFTFNCSLELKESSATYQRSIFIPPAPSASADAAIDQDSLWPKTDAELRPGDWLLARLRAAPKQSAQFRLEGKAWLPMREGASGVYEGAAQAPSETLPAAPLEYKLEGGWTAKTAKSRGLVAVNAAAPQIAAVRAANRVLRTAPGGGYFLFPSSGTRLVTAGRQGAETKIALSSDLSAWIDTKDLEFLPAGTFPPRATSNSMNTRADKTTTTVGISLTERVPFAVEESDDLKALTVRLYYTAGHTNWVVYDPADTLVNQIRFRQDPGETLSVTVSLNQPLWGYRAFYEGSVLKLELRRAPAFHPAGSALAGRTIFLDPGHMPSATGATGPMGTREMDANYAIAKAVEARLAKEGAFPILSRDTTSHEVSLVDRPRLAVEKKAELFVSLHNNALPDGENPFSRPRGYSVFYYHPHSLALARELHAAYQKKVSLPDEELRYGDLLVARLTAIPAVLVESAYMILPAQEEKLNDPAFRATLADAVVGGLRSFLEKERAKRSGTKR